MSSGSRMKKNLSLISWLFIVIVVAFMGYYYFVFVMSRTIQSPNKISVANYHNKGLSLQLTDSYFFISSIDTSYSSGRDTFFLVVRESTLANIFVKKKRGDKIVSIDSRVKVINYCGINKEFTQLYMYTAE